MTLLLNKTIMSSDTPLLDLRAAASHYSKALESVAQARKKLTEVMIKYIIANGIDLGKCTELSISENLGLPRSVVRSILLDLVEEKVLKVSEYGNTKPYMLSETGLGIALDWMGLSFTRAEVNALLASKEAEELKGMLLGSPLVFSETDEKRIARYRGIAADQCLGTLVGRFFEYIEEDFYEKLRKAFDEKILKELELLNPELIAFERLVAPPPPIGEWAREKLQELDDNASSEDIRKVIIESYEKNLEYVIRKLKKFATILEEMGYEGLHKHFKGKTPSREVLIKEKSVPEYRFHDEYLWATTLALREGCKIGQKIGANPELLKEALLLADVLDIALEKKYRGAKAEGLSLMEWGIRQLSQETNSSF